MLLIANQISTITNDFKMCLINGYSVILEALLCRCWIYAGLLVN
mgnify:FL=1